jgi:hypothetical protein
MEDFVMQGASDKNATEEGNPGSSKRAPPSKSSAWLTATSSSPGGTVSQEYVPNLYTSEKLEDLRFASRIGGVDSLSPIERDRIPKTLLVGRTGSGKVPGILGWSLGPFIVNQRVRDILEELEPGDQTFHPITIKARDGKKIEGVDELTYYIVLQPPVLDCIDFDGTTWGDHGTGKTAFEKYQILSIGRNDTIALRKPIISGHHFWRAPPPR